ncbi:hypothetical protein V8E51_016244 [Hyaloscypha variabilis]
MPPPPPIWMPSLDLELSVMDTTDSLEVLDTTLNRCRLALDSFMRRPILRSHRWQHEIPVNLDFCLDLDVASMLINAGTKQVESPHCRFNKTGRFICMELDEWESLFPKKRPEGYTGLPLMSLIISTDECHLGRMAREHPQCHLSSIVLFKSLGNGSKSSLIYIELYRGDEGNEGNDDMISRAIFEWLWSCCKCLSLGNPACQRNAGFRSSRRWLFCFPDSGSGTSSAENKWRIIALEIIGRHQELL